MDTITSKRLGDSGEDFVAQYLLQNGLEILARNWRAGGGRACVGELDIVATDGVSLLVVEVKSRRGAQHWMGEVGDFSGEAGLTPTKAQRLLAATDHYLQTVGHTGPVEFCLAVVGLQSHQIRFYRNISF